MLKINQLLIDKSYKPNIEPRIEPRIETHNSVMDRSTCQSPGGNDNGVDHSRLSTLADRESHESRPLVSLDDTSDQKSEIVRPSCFAGLIRSILPCLSKQESNYPSDGQSDPVPEEGDKARTVAEHSPLVTGAYFEASRRTKGEGQEGIGERKLTGSV